MAKKKRVKRKKTLPSTQGSADPAIFSMRPRVFFVCKLYNISDHTLLDFLKSKGYKNLNQNSLLDNQALELVDNQFIFDKLNKDKVRGRTEAKFVGSNSTLATKLKNKVDDKFYREPVLYLQENIFEKHKQQIKFKNCPILHSNFTNIEAISICEKMSSSYARNLCRRFDKPTENKQSILYQLHHIANKALRLFGGKLLTFISRLRNLQFKNLEASEIKTYDKVIPDFPIISFDMGSTSFKISFFLKQHKTENKLKPDIRLFAPKSYKEIGVIDEEGYVMTKLEKFKPQLSLFYQSTKNNSFKIYSGVETGNCEICGHELTDPISLRIGLGPYCAKNMGVDSSLYNFK